MLSGDPKTCDISLRVSVRGARRLGEGEIRVTFIFFIFHVLLFSITGCNHQLQRFSLTQLLSLNSVKDCFIFYNRGGEPIYYHGSHKLWIFIAGGPKITIDFILKFYLCLTTRDRGFL